MKKLVIILFLFSLFIFYSCLVQKKGRKALHDLQQASLTQTITDSLFIIAPGIPEDGNAEAGYQYLLYGNGFSSGIPYDIYKTLRWAKNSNLSSLNGYSRYVLNEFILFKNEKGKLIAASGCLHCHSQQFNNKWVIGLGNSYSNFQDDKTEYLQILENSIKLLYGKKSDEWKTAQRSFEAGYLLAPLIRTEVQGTASAHRIAEVMSSHRDPETLVFRADTSYFFIPPIVIPEDIPPLWNFKKKNASFINAMAQGDMAKHLMCGTMISLKDTVEAREIYNHMKDVWAYIKTLEPPPYPYAIDKEMAGEGKLIFENNCSACHGTYGENEYYPNLLVAPSIIGTDPMMLRYYSTYPEYAAWYNKSWYAVSSSPGFIMPQYGYVAPPLDGVWMTAPYLHNGSIPTIEAVLNSNLRPGYWKRSFTKEKYDYKKLGWQYSSLKKAGGKKTYNTHIPGYSNQGHYFGDHLSDKERMAVMEYLKTL